ncbi:hypothetical protein ACVII1_002966 [Bradyrhizobium elkanii]
MSTNKHNCSRTVASKIIIHKDQGCILPPMPTVTRPIAVVTALALAAGALGGCSSTKLSAGMADAIPAWAGGLPSDAPPRPGTPEYDKFMQDRERKRLTPAAQRGDEAKPATAPQNAAH